MSGLESGEPPPEDRDVRAVVDAELDPDVRPVVSVEPVAAGFEEEEDELMEEGMGRKAGIGLMVG